MWEHETLEPTYPTDPGVEVYRLAVNDEMTLEATAMLDGKYYVTASYSHNHDTFIGHANGLEEAKRMAEKWLLERAAEMLEALGAEGILMVRGAAGALLAYTAPDEEGERKYMPPLTLEPPHERILLVRFPTGDGEPGGIEYF